MATPTLTELLQLSVSERIQLVQDLWDSLVAEPETLPISEAQREEVARRSDAHRREPELAVPLEDALDEIERGIE
jgi:putative addiction module component (TIGR02574 family)